MTMKQRTVKIGDFDVHLQSLFGEYNCGNKTCGRLTISCTKPDDTTNYGAANIVAALEDKDTRNKIIKNFLEDIDQSTMYPSLASGCSFFPTDKGHYRPGVLLYADSIRMDKAIKWYNNWKGLIEVFEQEPEFGVVVLKSPIIPNRYYGASQPSRVWTLCLPTISKHVCWDEKHVTKEMMESLKTVKQSYSSPMLAEELKQLGVA